MKRNIFYFLSFYFAFANVHAQEFKKPVIVSPESTFYQYLDNEKISDPSKYNGNVKKVIRTYKEYESGVDVIFTQKTMLFVNTKGQLERTEARTYSYGIEDSKDVTFHLKEPKASIETNGNQTIKTVKREVVPEGFEYEPDLIGDDKYVYENDRLIAYYNNSDSISYVYDEKDRLLEIHQFESFIAEEYNDEDESVEYFRSGFEDKFLELVRYKNDVPTQKIVYDKFGEVIDVYKKTYTYSEDNLLMHFETIYKRYLFDYYEIDIPIANQPYETFPVVVTSDSIQKGTFEYSKTNKITAYQRTKGEDKENYTVTYDAQDRMHLVEGTLVFYQKGNLVSLDVEYEYLYDEKVNPKSIKSYYYLGGEKILHKETIFEIEYYE
ncbi:hypothetical protein [Kordia jejudonensis]|uniref:hypothetical protein n=1 Tax=Kordia jejudonensis TaxID=1348245 RepID=UPI00062913C8|nr:hypothetical protein [Kordia jejudonensis]